MTASPVTVAQPMKEESATATGGVSPAPAGEPAIIVTKLTESLVSPEELVARAIAPVKHEFLRPPPVRPHATSESPADDEKEAGSKQPTNVLSDKKKSRRQLKRERKQERKSVLNICSEVARNGNADKCPYGGACRFSHDVDAFLAQKPADLDGICPFVKDGELCPYGLACRFFNTHMACSTSETQKTLKNHSEINNLTKDLQKLLWKNKVSFRKADDQLKLLGLSVVNSGKAKSDVNQSENNIVNTNGSSVQNKDDSHQMSCNESDVAECTLTVRSEQDCLENASAAVETRPSKKVKSLADDKIQCDEVEGHMDHSPGAMEVQNGHDGNTFSCKFGATTKLHAREKKLIDFRGKLYLAPLTTVGNLPFRRVCKVLGADITCGEMAMCTNLLQGQASEWALLRRHSSEDLFGVQICGAYPDTIARTVELIERECMVDYIDINMGCPIDIVVNKGAGSCLLTKPMRMKNIIQAACRTMDKPLTVKVRTGYFEGRNRIDSLISDIGNWGATALTIHGRSRQQRYSKLADWDYIYECLRKAPEGLQVLGNGDVFSYTDWNRHISECHELSSCMIARGALIKPWIFTEIKEQRHWDITSGERFNILKDYVNFGLEHWGSDSKGVETTRHFLLEWLSYTFRYVPVGLLDIIPQKLNWRPPSYFGRNDLETLMASDSAADWIRISEMLLGKVPEGFTFAPKHKSNAYDSAENG